MIANFFMKINVVRQYKYLFNISFIVSCFFKNTFNQTTDNIKNIAIQAGNGIVKNYDSGLCYSGCSLRTFN